LDAIEAANDTTEADSDTAVNLIAAESDMKTNPLVTMTKAQLSTNPFYQWRSLWKTALTLRMRDK